MERLTGLDSTFLDIDTPEQPMVINGIGIVDVSEFEGGYSFERIRYELTRRLREVPQFRRKLYDSALNLGAPAWIEEYELDVDRHVHRVEMPEDEDRVRLLEMCEGWASHPLDRSRPLWEAWVVEGLVGPGRIAVFARAHHCVLDGMTAAQLIAGLALGTEPARPEARRSTDAVELVRRQAGPPSALRLLAGGAVRVATLPIGVLRLLPDTLSAPVALLRAPRSAGDTDDDTAAGGTDVLVDAEVETPPAERGGAGMAAPFRAPRTVFNAALTPHRAIGLLSLNLTDVKEVKNAFGVTVNDVMLTVVAGGLRRYLEQYDDLPDASLLALVPVSTHGADGAVGGNRMSVMFASLHTEIADAVDRLSAIATRTVVGKRQHSGISPTLLEDWARLVPPALVGGIAWLYETLRLADHHPVLHNLLVSNVPGPPVPLGFMGARVEHMYPMAPVFHGAGVSVTMLSFDDTIDVGVLTCAHLVPDPERIAAGMRETFDQLLDAART